MRRLFYQLSLVVLLAGTSAAPVLARDGATSDNHATTAVRSSESPEASESPEPSSGIEHGRLDAAKAQSCQKRQKAVTNIMARIVDRGTKQIGVFDAIATRTETFYSSHNLSLANYATLVAAVNAAKTKAQTDLAAVKAADTFSCTSSDPKGQVITFKTALKLEIADLKAYKTAVKNLIVGVKSVAGTTSPSPSVSPSSSPAVSGGQE